MGYVRPETVYKLVFEDHPGLEVKAASIPFGKLLDVADLADRLKDGKTSTFADGRELFDLFGSRLRSWNLEEEDGTPVPCTTEAVYGLEFDFATGMLLAWLDAIGSVPRPLDRTSTGGSPSAEPWIPTETLSPSLPS